MKKERVGEKKGAGSGYGGAGCRVVAGSDDSGLKSSFAATTMADVVAANDDQTLTCKPPPEHLDFARVRVELE